MNGSWRVGTTKRFVEQLTTASAANGDAPTSGSPLINVERVDASGEPGLDAGGELRPFGQEKGAKENDIADVAENAMVPEQVGERKKGTRGK